MRTITILKLDPGQKIPRPFSTVSSQDELVETLAHWAAMKTGPVQIGAAMRHAKAAAERAAADPKSAAEALGLKLKNVDREQPVVSLSTSKFYAFTQE